MLKLTATSVMFSFKLNLFSNFSLIGNEVKLSFFFSLSYFVMFFTLGNILGTWETKISNREKRQQRKRDKVMTDGGSGESNLQGTESTATVSIEQLMPPPSLPVGLRKNKGMVV